MVFFVLFGVYGLFLVSLVFFTHTYIVCECSWGILLVIFAVLAAVLHFHVDFGVNWSISYLSEFVSRSSRFYVAVESSYIELPISPIFLPVLYA